jgi:hypothetical protein
MSVSLYIKNNIISISSILLTLCVVFIYKNQPGFIYNLDGSYKDFGLGKRSKTVFPIWFCILVMAILIYTLLRFLIILPRMK